MRRGLPFVFVLLGVAGLAAQHHAGELAHLRFLRRVEVASAEPHYVAVDEETWRRARGDLGDLRLQDADGRVTPHALRTAHETPRGQELSAAVLQPGRVGARTRFWIAIPDAVPEYERVRLDLDARNFVARALVEGAHTDDAAEWTALGESTLFDFEREELGSSFVLRLPVTRFRYLRVTLPPDVRPGDVRGAYVPRRVPEPRWMPVTVAAERREDDGLTIFSWDGPAHIPIARVRFAAGPDQTNFIRRVEVRAGDRVVADGTIRRVDRRQGGTTVQLEELEVDVPAVRSERVEVRVHNGDDPPLALAQVTPLAVERRLYFDPRGHRALTLYFGDPEMPAPEYDFARLFQDDGVAREARLGPVSENPAWRPRPDTRPWTERYPWVLWSALAIGVSALGLLAFRALRSG